MLPRLRPLLAALFLLFATIPGWGMDQPLRVAVLENSPPMSFRDSNGQLSGFSIHIAQALCQEMQLRCEFEATTLDRVVEATAMGEYDIAAVSLLDTPERRAKLILAKPYFRSISLWFAKAGIQPGQPGIRVAVVKGSAQETYARGQGWDTIGVPTNGQLGEPLAAGIAQAAIVPMMTSLRLNQKKSFQQLGLSSSVMQAPALAGDASFGISPHRPELKEALDAALDRIKRNGVYDRINSQFLPFRVN